MTPAGTTTAGTGGAGAAGAAAGGGAAGGGAAGAGSGRRVTAAVSADAVAAGAFVCGSRGGAQAAIAMTNNHAADIAEAKRSLMPASASDDDRRVLRAAISAVVEWGAAETVSGAAQAPHSEL